MTSTPQLAPICGAAILFGVFSISSIAYADENVAADTAEIEDYSFHGQFTNVTQYHPSFASPYRGANSLDPGNRGDETIDLTLFAGARLWRGGEVYADFEVDQGFGLSNTLGIAGFPSAEAYKIGAANPYARLPRAFFRQTINLGGEETAIEPDQNQLGGTKTADNIVITAGKFSLTDMFDTNSYAHDPKADFMNWTIVDAGAYDYGADAWGYIYGLAIEWNRSWWTLRAAVNDLSRVPNTAKLERGFDQYAFNIEAEERHALFGQPGKFKILFFDNFAKMGNYADALRLSVATGNPPDTALVRRFQSRPGGTINFEQQILADLGVFARGSYNDGAKEAYEFTDVNESVSGGFSLKGAPWDRTDDTLGLAGVVNALSSEARRYFAAGGLGILIGDGKLPHYETENIMEVYYSAFLTQGMTCGLDYQYIENPGYNADRGPVSVIGFRIHAQF